MTAPPLPAGLVRSLALLAGAATTIAAVWRAALPVVAASDALSITLIVGGVAVLAWAAARVSQVTRLTPARSFAAGLALPLSAALLIPRRTPRTANDNDHFFNGSWPQFISE